jgi:predicted PurR-regulated permease PerM
MLPDLLTIISILLVIGLPLWFFGQVIFNQIADLFNKYKTGGLVIDKSQLISGLPEQVQNVIQNFSEDLNNTIGRLSNEVFSSITSLLSNVASFIISFFMFLFITYYLLKDAPKIKKAITQITPIAHNQEDVLINKIVEAVNGVVKGSFLVALSQGLIATIGFYIFGVPEPLLWGAFTVIVALVPTVGTAISIVPAVIYLIVTGHSGQAIGMTIWGVLAVGLIDNFLGPKLIGGSAKLHPVLVLIAIIGGIQLFGILGFLIGPIIMAIFMAMLEMYRSDFRDNLLGR